MWYVFVVYGPNNFQIQVQVISFFLYCFFFYLFQKDHLNWQIWRATIPHATSRLKARVSVPFTDAAITNMIHGHHRSFRYTKTNLLVVCACLCVCVFFFFYFVFFSSIFFYIDDSWGARSIEICCVLSFFWQFPSRLPWHMKKTCACVCVCFFFVSVCVFFIQCFFFSSVFFFHLMIREARSIEICCVLFYLTISFKSTRDTGKKHSYFFIGSWTFSVFERCFFGCSFFFHELKFECYNTISSKQFYDSYSSELEERVSPENQTLFLMPVWKSIFNFF